jgi:signal transduction histidine kinase
VAQLEERQQMLYEAEKLASVGQLAAGMAHEINNPLGFVRSNLSTFTHYLQKLNELKGRLADAPSAWRELDLDFVLEDGSTCSAKRRSGSNASPASSPT